MLLTNILTWQAGAHEDLTKSYGNPPRVGPPTHQEEADSARLAGHTKAGAAAVRFRPGRLDSPGGVVRTTVPVLGLTPEKQGL